MHPEKFLRIGPDCSTVYSRHGCPHIGANGVSWKMGEKLKSENMQNTACLCYILRAIRAGRHRERRYADHIFLQIGLYFRMHHFVVKFSKFSLPQTSRGYWPPPQPKTCGRPWFQAFLGILPKKLTIPSPKRLPNCVLQNLFFSRDNELQIYHGNFLLMDNKHR